MHRSNISLTSLRNPLGAGGSASMQGLASADSGELRAVEGSAGGEAGPSSRCASRLGLQGAGSWVLRISGTGGQWPRIEFMQASAAFGSSS